jgi:hypothetical protein
MAHHSNQDPPFSPTVFQWWVIQNNGCVVVESLLARFQISPRASILPI